MKRVLARYRQLDAAGQNTAVVLAAAAAWALEVVLTGQPVTDMVEYLGAGWAALLAWPLRRRSPEGAIVLMWALFLLGAHLTGYFDHAGLVMVVLVLAITFYAGEVLEGRRLVGAFVLAYTGYVVTQIVSNDGLVADDYYKQGLAINQTLSRDRTARAGAYTAHLLFTPQLDRVRVSVSGAKPPDAVLLRFVHPTRAGEDRTLRLSARAPGVWIEPRERSSCGHVGPDRQQRACLPWHHRPQMHVAGKHDVG